MQTYIACIISLLLGSLSSASVVGMLADDKPNNASWLAFSSGVALFSLGLMLVCLVMLHAELVRKR
jgi:hypothetical protein